MKHISSRHNPLVARFRAVTRGDDRALMLLDGVHLVTEALAARTPLVAAAFTAAALDSGQLDAVASALDAAGVELYAATAPVMDLLSPVRSSSPVVALAERPAHAPDALLTPGDAPVVVACGIQDPGNVGAILRVAEAAGAQGVLVDGQSADPYGWKALRGSMGSALRLPLAVTPDVTAAIASARARGWRIIATVPRGGAAPDASPLDGAALLLIGGEGQGLTPAIQAAADLRVSIPMAPPVESLNAAVCAALLVYEARRQRLSRGSTHGLAVPGHA